MPGLGNGIPVAAGRYVDAFFDAATARFLMANFHCSSNLVTRAPRPPRKKSRNLFPAVLCVAALGIVTLVPFTKIWLNFNLGSKKSARERIVQQISAGMLTPNRVLANGVGVISLPKLTPNISAGGNEIETATRDGRTYVFFYTYRGILNSYAGFLYVPTGGNPDAYPDLKSDPQAISDRYEEHWYFVSHRN